jgi:hypothetical protein
MGGFNHTGVANASANDQYVAKGQADAAYQPVDADLTAIAALSTTGLIERTGAGAAAIVTATAAGKALLDDADAAAQRTTLGLGTMATAATSSYQPVDGDLTAIAALSGTGYSKRTADNTWALDTDVVTNAGGASFGAAFGYASGQGGTVTQSTSKSTGVTMNKLCGLITTTNSGLATGTNVSFTLTNSTIEAEDVMVLNVVAGTAGSYNVNANCNAGTATITIRNVSAATLSEAVGLQFVVIKAVQA